MVKRKPKKKKERTAALFIPAGLFIGMGVGFLVDSFVAWMYIGLGVGFLLFGLFEVLRKK